MFMFKNCIIGVLGLFKSELNYFQIVLETFNENNDLFHKAIFKYIPKTS